MVKLQVHPRVEIIQGALLLGTSYNGATTSVSFYNALGVGQPHVAEYSVDVTSKIENYRENDDLSIEFDYVGVSNVRVHTTMSTNQTTSNVTYVLEVDKNLDGSLEEVFRQVKDLSASFDTGNIPFNNRSNKIHIKLQAGQSYSISDIKLLRFRALTGTIDDEFNFYLGSNVFRNTNQKPPPPKEFRPYATRKNGVFKSHEKHKGWFKHRVNGSWIDKSVMLLTNKNKAGVGKHRIRKNNNWKGQSDIGN